MRGAKQIVPKMRSQRGTEEDQNDRKERRRE